MITKSFKKKTLTLFLLLSGMFAVLLGCSQKSPTIEVKQAYKIKFPSNEFGKTLTEIFNCEKTLGAAVTKDEEKKIVLSKYLIDNKEIIFTYYFDKEDKYRYAVSVLPADYNLNLILKGLSLEGFEEQSSLSKNIDEKVFFNNDKNLVISLSVTNGEKYSYSFGQKDESPFSWTRISPLVHECGLWIPLLGKDLPFDLIHRFEKRMGHKLNTETSKPNSGVYIFNTDNIEFPKVRYWLDNKNARFLEEAKICVKSDNNPLKPGPIEVSNYLKSIGFVLTFAKDEKNQIYYNKEMKSGAIADFHPSNNPALVFEPGVHFLYDVKNELADKVPKEVVNLPIPILEFGKITMAEAEKEYAKLPYYLGKEQNPMDGINIQTNSEDFSIIWIMEDSGKYAMAIAIAKDNAVINSPSIVTQLNAAGFTEKYEQSAVETYINRAKNVMVQIDRIGTLGAICVAFSANEF